MASIKILLRNKPNQIGRYPVVLKIIKDRKVKVITLGFDCEKKDWDYTSNQFKKSHPNYIRRNRILLKYRDKAYGIIDEFNLDNIDFSLQQFESVFRGKKVNQTLVKEYWEEKVTDLVRSGRTGNAKVYRESMHSFFKFAKNEKLRFKDINSQLLEKYETYLFEKGSKNSGVSVRMRTLRALFNNAINNDVVDGKYYPFKKYKISNLKSNPVRRALSREDILKIINFDIIQYPHLAEAQRFFLFSYYTRGMNFHDMMKLRWSDINNGKITYIRSKTKGRFVLKILPPVQEILNYYKKENHNSEYIFPILHHQELKPMQIQNRKDKKLKKYNSELKKIAEATGIRKDITSYVARHSYATNMKYLGISTDIITESMGHKNPQVTKVYLKDFDTSTIDKANERLLEEPNWMYVAS